MKKYFLMSLLCFGIALTSCFGKTAENNQENNNGITSTTSESEETPITEETSFDRLCDTFKLLVKNNNAIASELGSNKECKYTGYTFKRDGEDESKGTLNIYGKVYNESNTYNSYLTLSYIDVALDNLFTQNKETKMQNRVDWYENINNFIQTANYGALTETKTNSFAEFDTAVAMFLPDTIREALGWLDSCEVKCLTSGRYNIDSGKYYNNVYTEDMYSWNKKLTDGSIIKVNTAAIIKISIILTMSSDEYNSHADNPSYFIDKFIEYAQNSDNNLRVSKSIIDIIENDDINDADLGVEL